MPNAQKPSTNLSGKRWQSQVVSMGTSTGTRSIFNIQWQSSEPRGNLEKVFLSLDGHIEAVFSCQGFSYSLKVTVDPVFSLEIVDRNCACQEISSRRRKKATVTCPVRIVNLIEIFVTSIWFRNQQQQSFSLIQAIPSSLQDTAPRFTHSSPLPKSFPNK